MKKIKITFSAVFSHLTVKAKKEILENYGRDD